MELKLDEAITVLSGTPGTLKALFAGVPGRWLHAPEGPDRWSPFDVVGHLIHGEKTDWMPRIRIILEDGESRAFDPFDRSAQFSRDQDANILDLLEEFQRLRTANVRELQVINIAVSDLDRTGVHPALGRVTLGQLISTWVVHDLDHLSQIARAMAKQYCDRVGPWAEYLSILGDRC